MKAPSRVGETVWVFDIDRRVYPKAEPGHLWASGGPIYREHFVPRIITTDIPRGWKLSDGTFIDRKTKASKADIRGYRRRIYTAQEVDDAVFIHDQREMIATRVRRCENADTLKAIDALLTKSESR